MYKAMIVDDEPAIREGLSSIIDWGIVASVLSIRQGTDARLWISSESIDRSWSL